MLTEEHNKLINETFREILNGFNKDFDGVSIHHEPQENWIGRTFMTGWVNGKYVKISYDRVPSYRGLSPSDDDIKSGFDDLANRIHVRDKERENAKIEREKAEEEEKLLAEKYKAIMELRRMASIS